MTPAIRALPTGSAAHESNDKRRDNAMQIQLNGEAHTLAPDLMPSPTIAGLIESLGLAGRRIAVEVNEEIVPRSEHAATRLAEGDRVEVVHAIGGG